MTLTTEQVYLLNTLGYISKQNAYDARAGMQVQDFVEGVLNSKRTLSSITDGDMFMSADQVRTACEQIRNDELLCNMDIAYADRTTGGADRLILTMHNEQGQKEAYVVFEGTMGGNEWRDNFLAGTTTDQEDQVSSLEQKKTLDWFQENAQVNSILNDCDRITVSGHSKGGNKAKYLTLFDGRIDECISFDGQGFSDEFVTEHEDKIRLNQGKIQNYNHTADYVNCLLNDVGEMHYIAGKDCGGGIGYLQNHAVFSLNEGMPFAENETEQYPLMKMFDEALNGYLRTLSPDEKKAFLSLTGEVFGDLLGGDKKLGFDDAADYIYRLTVDQGARLFGDFIDYAKAYGRYEFCEVMESWTKDTMPWMSFLFEQAGKAEKLFFGVSDGKDIRYPSVSVNGSGAVNVGANIGSDLLVMDTDELRGLSSKVASLCAELNECANRAEMCAELCDEYNIRTRISVSVNLKSVSSNTGSYCSRPANVLQSLGKDIRALRRFSDRLSKDMMSAAKRFEETEEQIVAAIPKDIGIAAKF